MANRLVTSKGRFERKFSFGPQYRKLHGGHRSAAARVQMRENRAVVPAQGEVAAHSEIRLEDDRLASDIVDGKA